MLLVQDFTEQMHLWDNHLCVFRASPAWEHASYLQKSEDNFSFLETRGSFSTTGLRVGAFRPRLYIF